MATEAFSFRPIDVYPSLLSFQDKLAGLTKQVASLSQQFHAWRKAGKDETELKLDAVKQNDRSLLRKIAMQEVDLAPRAKVLSVDLTEHQKAIAEYLHDLHSQGAQGARNFVKIEALLQKLDLGSFDKSRFDDQRQAFSKILEQQKQARADSPEQKPEDPFPNLDLTGFSIRPGSSAGGESRELKRTSTFMVLLRHLFASDSDKTNINALKEYKLAVVDYFLGTVSRYYENEKKRKASVSENLNEGNANLRTLVKAIDYFLKLN